MNEFATTPELATEYLDHRTGAEELPHAISPVTCAMKTASEPKQAEIEGYGNRDTVDERIAGFVKELWRCGLEPLFTEVEDHGDREAVYLEFYDPAEATDFVNLVAKYDDSPEGVYRRMLDDENFGGWEFGVRPEVMHDPYVEACRYMFSSPSGAPMAIKMTVSVLFPLSDVPALVEGLACRPTFRSRGCDQTTRGADDSGDRDACLDDEV
jgi:hypothetical protein